MLRRPLIGEVMMTGEDDGQQFLAFIEADRKAGKQITGYEYAVLVTNTDYAIVSLGQLYRDRADAENAFDELKNQWGWGGFNTHDLHRCQLTRMVAFRIIALHSFVRRFSEAGVALLAVCIPSFLRLNAPKCRADSTFSSDCGSV